MLHQLNISTDLSKLSQDDFDRLTKGPESVREKAKKVTPHPKDPEFQINPDDVIPVKMFKIE